MEKYLRAIAVSLLMYDILQSTLAAPQKSKNKIPEDDSSCQKLWQCFSFEIEEGSEVASTLSNVSSVCETQMEAKDGSDKYGWQKFRKTCRTGPFIDLLLGNPIEPGARGDYHLCMLTGLGMFDSDFGINFSSVAHFIRKVKGRDQHRQSVEKVAFDCGKRVISGTDLPVMDKLWQFQDCLVSAKMCS